MRLKNIGEIGLIKRLARGMRLDGSVVKGIGDDAAVIKWTEDKYLLFTCDMLVEDVHFTLGKAAAFQIGWKALARNISDIAAMGGVPRYALVSIGAHPDTRTAFLDGIYNGIRALADKFDINIVGGDTSKSSGLVIDISLLGEVEKPNLVTRNGAKEGDLIFVTGSIGGSIKGKHLDFMPRLAEARKIITNFKINSMIDISDGLVLDLWRILDASKVGARIYESTIPLSKEAVSFKKAISQGEDFELLFTMFPAEAKRFLRTIFGKLNTPVTLIGEIMNRRCSYRLVDKKGKEANPGMNGYLHF